MNPGLKSVIRIRTLSCLCGLRSCATTDFCRLKLGSLAPEAPTWQLAPSLHRSDAVVCACAEQGSSCPRFARAPHEFFSLPSKQSVAGGSSQNTPFTWCTLPQLPSPVCIDSISYRLMPLFSSFFSIGITAAESPVPCPGIFIVWRVLSGSHSETRGLVAQISQIPSRPELPPPISALNATNDALKASAWMRMAAILSSPLRI